MTAIKANELRIGNILSDGTVTGIVGTTVWLDDKPMLHDELCGIELSEEWLKRMGFFECNAKTTEVETGYDIYSEYAEKHIYIRTGVNSTINGFFAVFNHSNCSITELQFIRKVNFVHELQNLYFSLTGEELTLKK